MSSPLCGRMEISNLKNACLRHDARFFVSSIALHSEWHRSEIRRSLNYWEWRNLQTCKKIIIFQTYEWKVKNYPPRVNKSLLKVAGQPIPAGLGILKQSTFVPFFGNIEKANACTISINPSFNEFRDSKGDILSDNKARLCSRKSLDKRDDEELSTDDAQKVYAACLNYFQNNPYKRWFNKINRFIQDIDSELSYYDSTLVHLDLVQWATEKKWSECKPIQKELLKICSPFLKELLDQKKFNIIFLNGQTVVNSFIEKISPLDEKEIVLKRDGKKATLYFGTYKGTRVVGWSRYLQSQISNEAVKELNQKVSKILKEINQWNI